MFTINEKLPRKMKKNVASYPLQKRLRLRLRTKYSGYKNGDKILFPWYCGSEGDNKLLFNENKVSIPIKND